MDLFWITTENGARSLSGLFLVVRSYHALNGIRASADVRLARRPTIEGTPRESLCALQLAPPDAEILAI